MRYLLLLATLVAGLACRAQIRTDHVMIMGRNALYYEDYVLSIQRFNMVISAKPFLSEPYFYRALAKFYLEDYAGAEADLTLAIDRNPYYENNYVLRGLCRVNMNSYDKAAEDYARATRINPMAASSWHNLALCQIELKQHEAADSTLDVMIRQWPKDPDNYSLKAQLCFTRQDTVNALDWLERAIAVDSHNGQAWSMRAMVTLQRGEWSKGEEQLNKAITRLPRNANLYINRALARYNQNNLRGAMDDYDLALEIEPGNYLGHFNRGLLRAQVADDNRAIEDFDFVLEQEPDNMIALYNRALLLDNTGDYEGAIRDISMVIGEYPDFWAGYQARAAIRRKVGDTRGAELDEFRVLKAEMDRRAGILTPSPTKTRKRGERDPSKYDRLVVEDQTEAQKQEYASEYRGRVQNRTAQLEPLPPFPDSDIQGDTVYAGRPQELRQARLLYNFGTRLMMQGDHVSAIEMLTKALVLDHELPEAYYNRGIALLMSGGDRQAALRDLSQAGEYGLYTAYNLIKRYAKE